MDSDPPLSGEQFGNVTDLSAFRARRSAVREHPLRMTTDEMVDHLLHDHGVEPGEFAGKAMIEFMHNDLHNAGRENHVPTVPHTHSRESF